jgi:hypothetical protein
MPPVQLLEIESSNPDNGAGIGKERKKVKKTSFASFSL